MSYVLEGVSEKSQACAVPSPCCLQPVRSLNSLHTCSPDSQRNFPSLPVRESEDGTERNAQGEAWHAGPRGNRLQTLSFLRFSIWSRIFRQWKKKSAVPFSYEDSGLIPTLNHKSWKREGRKMGSRKINRDKRCDFLVRNCDFLAMGQVFASGFEQSKMRNANTGVQAWVRVHGPHWSLQRPGPWGNRNRYYQARVWGRYHLLRHCRCLRATHQRGPAWKGKIFLNHPIDLCMSNLAEGWWNLRRMSNLGMSCRLRNLGIFKIFIVSRILCLGCKLVHCIQKMLVNSKIGHSGGKLKLYGNMKHLILSPFSTQNYTILSPLT